MVSKSNKATCLVKHNIRRKCIRLHVKCTLYSALPRGIAHVKQCYSLGLVVYIPECNTAHSEVDSRDVSEHFGIYWIYRSSLLKM
jgi:hypothetical protein